MSKNPHCIIFHGTGGTPESNWFPWLANELRPLDVLVSLPKFPSPENQSLNTWMTAFREQIGHLTENMILIGHSMGVGMILRLLEETPTPVQGTFLVSGWEGLLGCPEYDPLVGSFYQTPLDYTQIRKNMGSCSLYHGDDDPYVPLTMGRELAANLGAPLTVVPEGGHLNAEKGLLEFPALLADIRKLLASVS